MNDLSLTPGTVSKILWHFTGGPIWNNSSNKQEDGLKSNEQAYKNLKSILSSKVLKLGSYHEIISVIYPEQKIYEGSGKWSVHKNVETILKSSPVCCLADIPIQHLRYHSMRYGRFAIGFYRTSAIRNNFNPVFYTLNNEDIVKNIYEGFSSLSNINIRSIRDITSDLEWDFNEVGEEIPEIKRKVERIDDEADYIETYVDEAQDNLRNYLAFIKTFSPDQFDTIYCEREWRSLDEFEFEYSDVAFVILPKLADNKNYVFQLIEELKLPRNITIASWEDLVEH